jgi:4-amino-4-deoxy-L-arabinose transferase-like glycosyltransferase
VFRLERSAGVKANARDAAILAALVAFGAWLRLPYLKAGIWRDEASTYYDVIAHGIMATIARVVQIELAPPGYFLVEKAWTHVAGTSEIALKAPSFAFGLALIAAMYALGRVAASRLTGLVAAFFACISVPAIALSGEARVYALAALATALVLTAYAWALRASEGRAPFVAFAALGTVLVYAHYVGTMLVGLLAVATPYVLWRTRQTWKMPPFALAFAFIAVTFAPWIPAFLFHAGIGTPYGEKTKPATLFDVANFDFGHLLPLFSRHGQWGIVFTAGLLVWGAYLLLRRVRGLPLNPPGAIAAFGFCTVAGTFVQAALSMREDRYLLVNAPTAWVWVAAIVSMFLTSVARAHSWRRFAGIAAIVAFAILILPKEIGARAPVPANQSGMRALAPRAIAVDRTHRTLFVIAPDYIGATFGYYVASVTGAQAVGFVRWEHPEIFITKGYRDLWIAPDAVPAAERRILAAMATGYDRLCLVRDDDLSDRGAMPYSKTKQLRAWLRATYRQISTARAIGRQESVSMEVFAP